ncbi:MAG TPA: hypothetical protein DCZ88_09135 [Pseudanabaena sp.]|nr:hypothetical protein [Pseudanabaena sp.]
MKKVRQSKNRANMNKSRKSIDLESAFRGEQNRDDLPEMATQSKDLITQNTKQATESLDSVASCVDLIEKKKIRIGIRVSASERRFLEIAAKAQGLSLSKYVRTLIPKNIAA